MNEIKSRLTVAQKIKAIRQKRGFTQEKLGELSGINAGNIRKYESGTISNPTYKTLEKLANALNVPVLFFVSGGSDSAVINELDQELIQFLAPEKSTQQPIANTRKNALLNYYESLNNTGQKEAVKRVKELTFNPEYKARVQGNTPARAAKTEVLNAAHERTDIEVTDEMRKHDDAIMDDENF